MIYVLTIADTTRVASVLRTQGIDAHPYSGETESERRLGLDDALNANDVKALVATSALVVVLALVIAHLPWDVRGLAVGVVLGIPSGPEVRQ